MRLLLKATLYYLIITMIVFGAGGIMTYNIFQKDVQRETDRYLRSRLWSLIGSVENGESPFSFISKNLSVVEMDNSFEESISFGDTLADHPSPFIDALEPHRKLVAVRKMQGQTFRIEIFDVIVESDDIFSGVFESQTRLFIILGAVLVISSFLISTWLFRPFNTTLQAIKDFRIKESAVLNFGKTNTREFRELNDILKQMIRKTQDDYHSLKEFSENASHELQTPLAVAKGKIELLLQSKGLDEEQLQLINSSYNAINHMSRMSSSLALLTKIENKEFSDQQEINLSEKVTHALFDFQELLGLKEISIERHVEENVQTVADPVLIQVLISNLLQNAVRHNIVKGKIVVRLTNNKLEINNTGKPLKSTSSDALFGRFKKDDQSSETIGLGLAIVRKICEINGYSIHYDYVDKMHCLTVEFE